MKYLVDANVLSEFTKPRPTAVVMQWLRRHEREVAVDPIILGEIRFGILRLQAGVGSRKLVVWFAEVIHNIECLPWDAETGLRWAKLLADLRAMGRAMPVKDSTIAATAKMHGLIVVARNLKDFASAGLDTIDPFTDVSYSQSG